MKQYNVTGMSCAACVARVEKAVSKVDGVEEVAVSLLTNSMGVSGSAEPAQIIQAVCDAGYGASEKESGKANASKQVEEDSLKDTQTPLLKKRLLASLIFWLPLMYLSMGHMMWGWPLPEALAGNHMAMGILEMLITIVIMIINRSFFVNGCKALFHASPNMDSLVALGAGAAFGYSLYAIFAMSAAYVRVDLDAVMIYMDEFYFESTATILTLITIGKTLEARSKGKTTDALRSLMKLSPKTARLLRDGQEIEVEIEEVEKDDIFLLRPGESVPVDGIVIEGVSAANESALTGESIPVDKEPGSMVSAATVNLTGHLTCRATKVGADTTLSKIIQMVSDAAASKAPIAKIADRVSGVFVPVVIALSLVTFVIWMLVGQTFGYAIARAISVLVISCPCALGLATPVAIMVGNGLGARNGILFKTSAALEACGRVDTVILDKTGTITKGEPEVTDYLVFENGDRIRRISAAEELSREASDLLCYAAALEKKSEHPLAKAIEKEAERRGLSLMESRDFQALSGHGLKAKVGDDELLGGSVEFILSQLEVQKQETRAANGQEPENVEANVQANAQHSGNVEANVQQSGNVETNVQQSKEPLTQAKKQEIIRAANQVSEEGKTPLLFTRNGKLLGMIAVADTIKEDAAEAIQQLYGMGLEVVMLTGDNERTAKAIAEKAGLRHVIAGVLPDGKDAVVASYQKEGKVAMVGDGINDAPALTRADIGIAIGAGTDIAMDAADVVLMKSDLLDLPAAIRLSRGTLRNIRENLFWAFIYNIIGIPLAAGAYVALLGWSMNPMFGAAAMSLSSFCVCSNALRLNWFKIYDPRRDRSKGRKDAEGFEATFDITISKQEEKTMEKTLLVEGMMCGHCEAHVKKALEGIEGIAEAVANHDNGTVVVKLDGEVSEEAMKAAVVDAGYEFKGIQ